MEGGEIERQYGQKMHRKKGPEIVAEIIIRRNAGSTPADTISRNFTHTLCQILPPSHEFVNTQPQNRPPQLR